MGGIVLGWVGNWVKIMTGIINITTTKNGTFAFGENHVSKLTHGKHWKKNGKRLKKMINPSPSSNLGNFNKPSKLGWKSSKNLKIQIHKIQYVEETNWKIKGGLSEFRIMRAKTPWKNDCWTSHAIPVGTLKHSGWDWGTCTGVISTKTKWQEMWEIYEKGNISVIERKIAAGCVI